VRAIYDIVRVPWQVAHGVSLYDTGNMRDPQMYLVSLCLLLAVLQYGAMHRRRRPLAAAIVVQGVGLILHFKRGVWISFCLAICAMGAWTRRWRMLAALALLIALSLFVPQVRQRIALLREVTQTSTGGRAAMWSEVAPVLLREYPQGMGWSAVTHDDLAAHAAYIQPGLNHLHNNLLQVALETGWLGLAVWILWMGVALRVMWRNARDATGDLAASLSLGILCAFGGLLANGMVEYNFGDTEILMLMCLLMGWSAAITPRAQARGGSNSPSSHANSSSRVPNSPSS
jgi:O-antigen ligase